MDTFLKETYIEIFKKWISFQLHNNTDFTFEIKHSQTYRIYYQDKIGEIIVWPMGVIEETIYENNNLLFYLHYELNHLHLAVDYFGRMIEQMFITSKHRQTQVLLCCTGGMTTSYFAEKLNNYCRLNHINVQVNATAVYHLSDIYQKYDMILVAPQLRYQVIELAQKYKPIVVESIDPVIFATYDCPALLNQIDNIKEKIHE